MLLRNPAMRLHHFVSQPCCCRVKGLESEDAFCFGLGSNMSSAPRVERAVYPPRGLSAQCAQKIRQIVSVSSPSVLRSTQRDCRTCSRIVRLEALLSAPILHDETLAASQKQRFFGFCRWGIPMCSAAHPCRKTVRRSSLPRRMALRSCRFAELWLQGCARSGPYVQVTGAVLKAPTAPESKPARK